MRTWDAVLIAAAALSPSAGLAQSAGSPGLPPGAEVRVMRSQAGGQRAQLLRGRLQRMAGDTIVVSESFDRQTTSVLGQSDVLETRVGWKTNARRGAAIGLVAGAMTGALVGAATYRRCTSTGAFDCLGDFGIGFNIMAGAGLFGLGGMVVGALIGSNTGTETWAPTQSSRVLLGVTAAPGGARLSVGLSF